MNDGKALHHADKSGTDLYPLIGLIVRLLLADDARKALGAAR